MSITNATTGDGAVPVVVGPSSTTFYRASEAQLEVWLASQQTPEANCAYNEISSIFFQGDLNVERLKSAIDRVIDRHDSFRSRFSVDGKQVTILPTVDVEFELHDWSDRTNDELEGLAKQVIQREGETPFDLQHGPLFRFICQKFAEEKFKLTFNAHHLILDGWSLAVFCEELGHFYDQLSGKSVQPLPDPESYPNYARELEEHEAGEIGQSDEAFWVDQYQDQIPVLELPLQNRRPALRTYEAGRFDHILDAELVEGVRKMGAKKGCSLFATMLAGFHAYLGRLSGCSDFPIGIPTAGQSAMDHTQLIGHCVNTIPLRLSCESNTSFEDHLVDVRARLLDGFEHQLYSFGSLLRKLAPPRDPSRPPMVNVTFNVDPEIDPESIGFQGLKVRVVVEPRRFENFEWFVNGVIQSDKSIEFQVQFNTDLFTEQAVAFYMEGFAAFLEDVVRDPARNLNQFHLMNIDQRRELIVKNNETSLAYPQPSSLADELTRQASETPEKVAVVFEERELTYAELDSRSNQLAHYLVAQGVGQGDLVGLCVERSEQMIVQLFGILKAGAGYVPLDPAYPVDRLQYMCDHSGLKLVISESELKELTSAFKKKTLFVDELQTLTSDQPTTGLSSRVNVEDVCYVIYTSGSTGKPKGVQVAHDCVVNFLYSMKETPGFGPQDSVLAVTTLSFDIAVLELYLPLICGGKVVVLDKATAADGERLAKQIKAHNISLLQATPATWRLLMQSGWGGQPDLKALCGGEPMPEDLVAPLLERCGELWNMYGPTETTVWSAAYRIQNADAPILIGKPIGNTQLYVLGADGSEVPPGCEGEVFIGGAGVTLGYRNQPEMTGERFVANRYRNPFVNYVNDRLYKTGDLARFRFDGNLEFLRRNDKQVKVRGFRIELGEIENRIQSHPSVSQNVVIVREDHPGDTRLVGYIIADQDIQASEIRDHLRKSLPFYMVPQHIVFLDSMPQTNNGKIDYKQLPVPTTTAAVPSRSSESLPDSPAEKYLGDVWKTVLEFDDVTKHDTFFDIGGHSLLVMKVISEVETKTGVRLSPPDFLVNTLQQLAVKIDHADCFGSTAEQETEIGKEPLVGREVEATKPFFESSTYNDENEAKSTEESKGLFRSLKGFWS